MDRATTLKIGLLLAVILGTGPAQASVLKLMVTDCNGAPLNAVWVNVVINRLGPNIAEGQSAVTQQGYVEFQMGALHAGDRAVVTISVAGGPPEGGHVYTWLGDVDQSSPWDIGDQLKTCPDGWFSEDEQIILCTWDGGQ